MPEKQDLENLVGNDSFVRWIRGLASQQEQNYWLEWIRQDPTHQELVEQAHELVKVAHLDKPAFSESKKELKKLEHSLDQMDARTRIKSINRRSGAFFSAVAAGVLLLIAALGLLMSSNYEPTKTDEPALVETRHEFRTDYGEKISLNLSDGSQIILNADSHLKYYSAVKQGQNIEVWLEGEAWFDITHFEGRKQRSFTVHTPDGAVEVLGTRFVVKTSPEGTQAVLEEGEIRVQVEQNIPVGGEKTEIIMKPGELARFTSGIGKVELSEVNSQVYISWTKNVWVFDETPLRQVANRIEDTFGVEVQIAGPLQQMILSGSIKSKNLEFLTKALSKVIDKPVAKQGNTIVIGEMDKESRMLD